MYLILDLIRSQLDDWAPRGPGRPIILRLNGLRTRSSGRCRSC